MGGLFGRNYEQGAGDGDDCKDVEEDAVDDDRSTRFGVENLSISELCCEIKIITGLRREFECSPGGQFVNTISRYK